TPRPPTHTLTLHDALPIYRTAGTAGRIPTGSGTRANGRGAPSSRRGCACGCVTAGVPDDECALADLVPLVSYRPPLSPTRRTLRSEEHTSELQSRFDLVCR